MSKEKKKIQKFKDFHREVPDIVKEISKDQQLALRAAVNPLLAMEELGYELETKIQKEVERILRFSPKERKRLKDLETEIHKLAGRAIDLDSPKEIETVLFKEFKLNKPKSMESLDQPDIIDRGATLSKHKGFRWIDPLRPLEKEHPIIAPLLEYRKLQVSRPGFAPRALYKKLKSGKIRFPITEIRLDFPEHDEIHEEVVDA